MSSFNFASNNKDEYASIGPLMMTATVSSQLQYVNWHFGNVGFGPKPATFKQTKARFFIPKT